MAVFQGAILDSTQGGYAACVAALLSATNSNISYTLSALPTQDVAANTDLKIVYFVAEEADFTGDAASLALTNGIHVTSDLCRGRFMKLSQIEAFAFHTIGDPTKSSSPIGENIIFLGQSNTGDSDGSTPNDTVTPEFYKTNIASAWASATLFVPVGPGVGTWSVGGDPLSKIPAFSDNVYFRMDYLANPGLIHTGYIDARSANNSWSRPDAGSFPRLWKATNDVGSPTSDVWLWPIDPTLSIEDIYTNHTFTLAASQTEVENTALSVWTDGQDIWVHMPSDDNPTSKIVRSSGQGWNIPSTSAVTSPATAFEGLEFINCQFGGYSQSASQGASGGTGKLSPRAKWLGGRWFAGMSWKPVDQMIDGTEWGYSTDGDIVYDTSDRPDPANDNYILSTVNDHGSDPLEWAKMSRYLHIDSAKEGIYCAHGGVTNNPDDVVVRGVLGTNIGSRHPVMITKRGADSYADVDSHFLATQGGSGWNCSYFYISNAGAAVVWYANGDSGATQNQQNNIFQDFVIVNGHGRASGAGGWGIDITGDGENGVRTGSPNTGLCSGNIIRRGHIEGIVSAYGGSPPIDGGAISLFNKKNVVISHVTMKDCPFCLIGGNTVTTNSTYVDDPAYLAPQATVSDCIFVTPEFYFWRHRFTNWTASGARPNLGFYNSNNNLYIYPSDGNVSTDTYFSILSDSTFADWQAFAKASPPGEEASVYDPDSTTELAA